MKYTLTLALNEIGDEGVHYLAAGLKTNTVIKNRFSFVLISIYIIGIQALQILDLCYMASRNETGDKGIEYLADALQANEVTCESFICQKF